MLFISQVMGHWVQGPSLGGWLLNSLGPRGLVKMDHFNTILTSPKSWLSQEDLDAGYEHSLVPMDS